MGLYSIKMRASKEEEHISGSENIVEEANLEKVVSLLIKRAMVHTKGKSDFINIKIEEIEKENLEILNPLEVTTIDVENHIQGINGLKVVLKKLGIDKEKSNQVVDMLESTYNMRGAMLLDINNLDRLEHDKDRGIRATYMDFEGSKLNHITKDTKHNSHFIEALALATKVSNAPNIIGEICYSDDPNYTAGYIASKKYGYIRFPHLKEFGSTKGGRIFLYDSAEVNLDNIDRCIDYIENTKVIIKDEIKINEPVSYDDILDSNFEFKIYGE